MIPASVAASADLGDPAWADPRACRNGWAACWLVAVQAASGAGPVDLAAVVSADEADSVDRADPVAVVAQAAAVPGAGAGAGAGADVAADRVDVSVDLADPADPAPASATASVKVDRTFAA